MKTKRSQDGKILEIDLSSPPVNALSSKDLNELAAILNNIKPSNDYSENGDTESCVVVLSTSGNGFNAGGDLKEIESLPNHVGIMRQCLESASACGSITNCAVPVIAAVQGYCIGLGISIVGSCDICVAAENTEFVFREIDNGAIGGGSQSLRLLSPQVVRYLMFTGGKISANELFSRGGIPEIVPASVSVLDRAKEIALIISQKDRQLLSDMKAALNGVEKGFEPEKDMHYEHGFTLLANIRGTASKMRQTFLSKTSKI